MSGGAWAYVMGVMKNSDGTALTYSNSGFTTSTLPLNSKYVDQYAYGTSDSDYTRKILGDVTGEVREWYSDFAYFVYSSYPWFYRGGHYSHGSSAGVFGFGRGSGLADSDYSFRVVLVLGA